MRLLVVGGRLQGTEAVYMAREAGFETVLVDRASDTPASGLAGESVTLDITLDEKHSEELVRTCDAVLPACEDLATLEWLAGHVPRWGVPLLFDLAAFRVTRSKQASRRLFDELGVARPAQWPACGFPVVVKPDSGSGSEGVTLARDERELAAAEAALAAAGHIPLVESYVPGPSLSLEVLAWDGMTWPLQATGLEFDAHFDCRRVVAPVGAGAGASRSGVLDWEHAFSGGVPAELAAVSARLAQGLGLRGIMDVEVVVRNGRDIVVLEVDARLPSQTPTAVYWSSGVNMLELLAATAFGEISAPPDCAPRRACVYQHVRADAGRLKVVGEHALATARPLHRRRGLAGADDVLTDRDDGSRRSSSWVATLITTGPTVGEARRRGDAAMTALAGESGLDVAPDSARVSPVAAR